MPKVGSESAPRPAARGSDSALPRSRIALLSDCFRPRSTSLHAAPAPSRVALLAVASMAAFPTWALAVDVALSALSVVGGLAIVVAYLCAPQKHHLRFKLLLGLGVTGESRRRDSSRFARSSHCTSAH